MEDIDLEDLNGDTRALADIVGLELALEVARRLGPGRLHLCSVEEVERRLKVEEAARLVEQGASIVTAARAVGVSEYAVRYRTGRIRGRGPVA